MQCSGSHVATITLAVVCVVFCKAGVSTPCLFNRFCSLTPNVAVDAFS